MLHDQKSVSEDDLTYICSSVVIYFIQIISSCPLICLQRCGPDSRNTFISTRFHPNQSAWENISCRTMWVEQRQTSENIWIYSHSKTKLKSCLVPCSASPSEQPQGTLKMLFLSVWYTSLSSSNVYVLTWPLQMFRFVECFTTSSRRCQLLYKHWLLAEGSQRRKRVESWNETDLIGVISTFFLSFCGCNPLPFIYIVLFLLCEFETDTSPFQCHFNTVCQRATWRSWWKTLTNINITRIL